MKTIKSLLIITVILKVTLTTIAQNTDAVSYTAKSKSIIVPEVKEKKIVIDGIFSPMEWKGAVVFPLSEKIEIYMLIYADDLYIGLKSMKPVDEAVAELYFKIDDEEFFNLHASGQPGEGINAFSEDFKGTKFIVGNNIDWEANPKTKNKEKCDGKEYRINLKKLNTKIAKMAGGMITVNIIDNKPEKAAANIPEKYSFKNSDLWVELILPNDKK